MGMSVHRPKYRKAEKQREEADDRAGKGDREEEPTAAFEPGIFHNNVGGLDLLCITKLFLSRALEFRLVIRRGGGIVPSFYEREYTSKVCGFGNPLRLRQRD